MNNPEQHDPTALCPTCDVQLSVTQDANDLVTTAEHEPGCRTAVLAYSDPARVAELRAFQLAACWLADDRVGLSRVVRELPDDLDAWHRLTWQLVALGWHEVCERHGFDPNSGGVGWPAAAFTQVEAELAAETNPHRQVALELTVASWDTNAAERAQARLALTDPAELPKLVAALVELFVSHTADPRALLVECRAAVALWETTLGVNP